MQECLVDSHVHLYHQFAPSTFLNAAVSNLRDAADALSLPPDTPGLLLFTRTEGEPDPAETLGTAATGWSAVPTGEVGSTRLTRDGKPDLFLVEGWQVVSEEGLEVLGLGLERPAKAGEPAIRIIAAIAEAGGIPVLPWGVGKWSGARAALVRRIAADAEGAPVLFIGDIAGRPGFLRRPGILAECEAHGRRILAGTDPLPFPSDARKVARLVFRARFDPERPFASLRDWLREQTGPLDVHGRHERFVPFVRLQLAMQIRKRMRNAGAA